MSDTKPSNPKDLIGSKKIDLGLVPDVAELGLAEAFFEGAVKYGRYNWRIAGVSASTYYAALKRHQKKWWNGQDADPITRVHHLKNAMACIAIILDAELYGMLSDDRPPCPDPDAMARAIDEASETMSRLRELFKDQNPKQYTIADTQHDEEIPVLVEPPIVLTPAEPNAGTAVTGEATTSAFDFLQREPVHHGSRCFAPGCYNNRAPRGGNFCVAHILSAL